MVTLKERFIDLKYIQNKSRKEIIVTLNISKFQYAHLLANTKNAVITEITTESLESLLLPRLNDHPDLDVIKLAVEIWKNKSKVPETRKPEPNKFVGIFNETDTSSPAGSE